MKSRICELFGIKYPIMQGGMQWLATPELAAAVSNAGGLGTMNSSLYIDAEGLREGIKKIRTLTENPFCVNISMLPNATAGELVPDFIKIVCEEQVPVVELSGRDPKEFVPQLKEAGIKIIHKSPAVRFARKAVIAGVDAVSIVGFECGGHPGMDDVTTFCLIPAVVDAFPDVPVIAGGGICDSRTYLAARCLGAEGVVMGTRFVATEECALHPNFKKVMIEADERSTGIVQRSIKNAARNYKNKPILELMELEARTTPSLEEVLSYVSGKRQKQAYLDGDVNGGAFPMGQCVGQIHEILTVKQVIDEIITGAEKLLEEMSR
ncbi:MAG: NAD(P)H-dependent flavin oxidoreductase [Anaerovoracaceae bacterium]